MAEVKLCECGCGKPAPIAKMTSKRSGTIKGQPQKFIQNHFHPIGNQFSDLPTLTGKVFGKWIVGEGRKTGTSTMYSCTCECGTVQEVRRSHLTEGASTQCINCRGIRKICKRGHDTDVCGRNSSGVCRMCAKGTQIFSKYGITIEEYEALYIFQKGKCAICGRKLALLKTTDKLCIEGRTEIDHKHYLKKDAKKINKKSTVRGLLCGGRWAGCNHKLGKVDNAEWLRAAAEYVSNPPAQQMFQESVK